MQPRSNSGLWSVGQPFCHSVTPPPLGETTRTPEFIRWKIPVKYEKQRISPLLFTVYSAAASGRSPALPCFAAFLALVCFSGLFAFTQLFFQTPIKWNRSYIRARRRGIKSLFLEFGMISCGFNLHKFHLKKVALRSAA